jgi:predicted nuclease with RNAse H fold
MRTLGVDLAAQPCNTGVCEIVWGKHGGTVSVLDGPHTDERLVALMAGADKVGVDVPFGWPEPFVDALVAHRDGREWPGCGRDPDGHRRQLRLRRTDEYVRTIYGRDPMSVSSNLLSITAMRWAGLEDRLRADEPIDRSGLGRVVEVYPAAALKFWGLRDRGYKGRQNRTVLEALVSALVREAGAGLRFTDGAEEVLRASDHAFDALISSLVARAALLGQTTVPPPSDAALAHTEGWIHVPTCGFRALFGEGLPSAVSLAPGAGVRATLDGPGEHEQVIR